MMTAEQRQKWAEEWCESHIELEYDDVVKGLVTALGVESNPAILQWLKNTRDAGRKFSKDDPNAYTLWGDLADEIDELLKGTL